jgi:quinoprotein glucose dehydrogenase
MALLPGDARLATQVESFLTPEDIMRISRRTACIVCRTPRDSHHGLPKPMHPSRRGSNAVWGLVALAMCLFPAPVLAQGGASGGEWRARGGEPGTTNYSPLDQITKDNVNDLRVAWEWVSVDTDILDDDETLRLSTNFQATPLMVGGVLYGTTGFSQAFALDATTGETLWVYNPRSYERPPNLGFVNRGLGYWTDGDEERLFLGTGDARLVALDPASGSPIPGFGQEGLVDTTEGIPRLTDSSQYGFTAAPTVVRDVVVMGGSITDAATSMVAPPGYVRGYDVRTGEARWTFHSIPLEGELGNDTWEDGSWEFAGNTNVWSMISADEELGYVYLPFGTPNNDFYGGHRPGDNLFAESLVCLDAETGELVWHFQMVHHGLWDYDLPAPPVLADITVEGRRIKALAQVSKQGFTYVFDRVTGEPVWPIEERPVPQSTVPGEQTSPTQPFPTRPPPFERQGLTVDDLIDFTPEVRAEALEIFERYDHGPIFTPPSLRGALLLPSYGGGANWLGASLDPETGILYVPSMSRVLLMQMFEGDPERTDMRYVRGGQVSPVPPGGLPLIKPPYGRITAIDLNRGDHVWMVPNGGDGPVDHPAIEHLDLPPLGTPTRAGVLVTKTLLFVSEGSGRSGSATGGGPGFRALDKATGEELWKTEFDGQVTGLPMTYQWEGKQYVVSPVGTNPPKYVALSLP